MRPVAEAVFEAMCRGAILIAALAGYMKQPRKELALLLGGVIAWPQDAIALETRELAFANLQVFGGTFW